ncbi:hypothetical protein C0989_005730 [Termitomyces sp. Mn162]|nr:hypothetical protein C0989_005730 [Termitomyces sp. Mn162]
MSSASAAQKKPIAISTTEGFICGGIAACIAVTISNPAEVAKTRLQLQGELAKGGGVKVYNNAVDVLRKTYINEGLRGVQRGLGPAYVYQILLNGSRLGFYEPIRHSINHLAGYSAETQIPFTSVLAGALSGAIGASLGNPLFLIKARMQAYSPALPVGAQHYYKNSFDALSTIFRAERFRGLVRGIDAAILRTSMGSSVGIDKLVDFDVISNELGSRSNFPALTRMYNQPTIRGPDGRLQGTLYKNPIDCLWKTFQAEGVYGWYKGSTAHFMRIAPHT